MTSEHRITRARARRPGANDPETRVGSPVAISGTPHDGFERAIGRLKRAFSAMLSERAALHRNGSRPGPLWQEALQAFEYVPNLSADDFRNIRFHTGLMTGESIFAYWAPHPRIDPERFADDTGYRVLTERLPRRLHIGEPPTPRIPRPIGVRYRGRVINHNTVRYQKCIANLHSTGILGALNRRARKSVVLEIGPGYGGLSHHLHARLSRAVHVLVDLPEMLLFSFSYLAANNRDKRIYLYERRSLPGLLAHGGRRLLDYDFVLLPNYLTDALERLPDLDLVVNTQSFQEMTTAQVRGYLAAIERKLAGFLYSDNYDRHPYNRAPLDLSRLLASRFHLYPAPEFYRARFRSVHDPRVDKVYKTYIASTDAARASALAGKVLYVSDLDRRDPRRFSIRSVVPDR